MNEKSELKNFDLNVRLSDSKIRTSHWDYAFIESELKPFAGKLKKIYVCGSPMMNESFDKAFE